MVSIPAILRFILAAPLKQRNTPTFILPNAKVIGTLNKCHNNPINPFSDCLPHQRQPENRFHPAIRTMNQHTRQEIFERLRAANPHPTTELHFSSPFELLIAVLLSAQATDKGVNKATEKLFAVANTPQAMLDLGLDGVREYVKTIGLYQTKSKHIMQTCRALLEKHGGEVPQTREELEVLAGVGRKTANVVLNTAFGQPVMAVDTHIFRVANRTGLSRGKTVREVEDKLMKYVPKEFLLDAHHWLILHGRYTCKAIKPQCPSCIINDLCEYGAKETAA